MSKHLTHLIVNCLLVAMFVNPATAQDNPIATSSNSIDPDSIKENIKKRIEQVIKDQKTDRPQKPIALLGTVSSITPNSITIETVKGDVEQASTSAITQYVETKTSQPVKREDASIGDFVAALGFMESNVEVLDTRRLLILRDPPTTPQKTSFFGTITAIDTKKNQVEMADPQKPETTKLFTINAKTSISATADNSLTNPDLSIEELNIGQRTLVIYTPATASTSASLAHTLLIKTPPQTP